LTLKSTPVIAVLLVSAALLFFLWHRNKRGAERTFKTTDEFIQWLASEAEKDAERENHVRLDYSIESIKSVEKILGQLHDQYALNPSSVSVKGLGSAYGAYVGEVIRRSEPGARWERDDAVGGEKSYPLIWGAGHSYPLGWCQKRIIYGDGDNVWVKYYILKERASGPKAPGFKVSRPRSPITSP
jgi:hypothetical protein